LRAALCGGRLREALLGQSDGQRLDGDADGGRGAGTLIHIGSPVISMRSKRRSSAPIITCSSVGARLAPRQKCGPPPPKETVGFGDRRMSKRKGSANTSLSRFAEG
jgi:hypothetical protein